MVYDMGEQCTDPELAISAQHTLDNVLLRIQKMVEMVDFLPKDFKIFGQSDIFW